MIRDIIAIAFFPVLFGVGWLILHSNTAAGRAMRASAERDIEAHRKRLSGH